MKGLKELKAIAELLDNAYQDYYETGEPINPMVIDEARDRLKELMPDKIYQVKIDKYFPYSGAAMRYSFYLGDQKIASCSGLKYIKRGEKEAIEEINKLREVLEMPPVNRRQVKFLEVFNK